MHGFLLIAFLLLILPLKAFLIVTFEAVSAVDFVSLFIFVDFSLDQCLTFLTFQTIMMIFFVMVPFGDMTRGRIERKATATATCHSSERTKKAVRLSRRRMIREVLCLFDSLEYLKADKRHTSPYGSSWSAALQEISTYLGFVSTLLFDWALVADLARCLWLHSLHRASRSRSSGENDPS